MDNYIEMKLPAVSKNEAFARNAIAAFCVELNPTVEEVNDIKTAVSEAVTNCIVHAYGGDGGEITIRATIDGYTLHIAVMDCGVGIDDVESALKPFYTTRPDEERSGMGFTIMETFMDELVVRSAKGEGTSVEMTKSFYKEQE